MRIKRFILLASLAATLGATTPGQEITGTVSGTVTDPTGAVIPDATVTLISQSTAASRQTSTTSTGVFFFNSVPVGSYELMVEKPGFGIYELKLLEVHVNDKLNFPVKLQVGATENKVVVQGGEEALQTESAEVSNLVGERQILALPLNGRDFNQLVDLVPGVEPDNGTVQGGVGLFSDTAISINGNQSNSNLFLVDGEYDLDSGGNGNLLVTPSVDSIEEFKVLRDSYSAEFGGATGGVINVVTKSGGQTFHGSAYEFLRNDVLDGNDPFLNASGQPRPKLVLNNFGFTGGGPFWIPGKYNTDKKSDFFFVSFEWRRQIAGSVLTSLVPSLRQREGMLVPPCSEVTGQGVPCSETLPFDPNESPVVNEANINQTGIDPNTNAFFQRIPLPNTAIANGFNYITSANAGTFDHQQLERWDHYFGSKTILSARYIGEVQTLTNVNDELFGLNDAFPSVNTDWHWYGKNAIVKLTTTLTPRLLNDFQFGYSNNELNYVTGANSDPTLASRDGFTYQQQFPHTGLSFPTLQAVEQFSSGGNGVLLQNSAPFDNRTDNFQYKDDLSYTFGNHNLKFGGFLRFNRKREPANGGGNFGAGNFTFNTFSDLLVGNVQTYSEEETQNNVQDRERDYALYVQDTYKLRPNLTLDLGLRWQFLAPIFSATDNIANFRPSVFIPVGPDSPCAVYLQQTGLVNPALCPANNGLVTPNTPGVSRSTVNSYPNDWEPRVGIAWQPLSRLVVRLGFGIYQGRDALSQTSSLGRQPPFDLIPSISTTTYSALTPFNPALPQPTLNLAALDQNYLNPESYQYSLALQTQLSQNMTLEVDYVGNHGIHLGLNRNINQVPAAQQLAVANNSNNINGCASDCVNPDTVRPYVGYSIINLNSRLGTSRYNSLQVFFNKRMSYGLDFQAAYTYSKNISDTINMDTEASTLPIQNANNIASEKALANQDQTQSLVFNYIWELPFFKNSSAFKKNAFGGWQIVGITTFRSGLPATICLDRDIAGTGTGGGAYECQRVDAVGNPNFSSGKRTPGEYFNVNAFVLQPLGTFGNASRNDIRLPGVNNWDLSIFKDFTVPWFGEHSGWAVDEHANLEFRAEFFNVWNHVQYNGVNTTFQTQTDTNGNPIAGSTSGAGSGFGQVNSARAPREIQFALKLTF